MRKTGILLFITMAIVAIFTVGCKKENPTSGDNPKSLTIDIARGVDAVEFNQDSYIISPTPITVTSGADLSLVTVSIIGSDDDVYLIENISKFENKRKFEKTYDNSDKFLAAVLHLMQQNAVLPSKIEVAAFNVAGQQFVVQKPIKITKTGDLTIEIANGIESILLDTGDLNSLAIPVKVNSTTSDITSITISIVGADKNTYIVETISIFTNPKSYSNTFTGSYLSATFQFLRETSVKPHSFCVEASLSDAKTFEKKCTPFMFDGTSAPMIEINKGEIIEFYPDDFEDITIPVSVSSSAVDLLSVTASIKGADNQTYLVKTITSFTAPRLYKHIFTVDDLEATLNEILEKGIEPVFFHVKATDYMGTSSENATGFKVIESGKDPLSAPVSFSWERRGMNVGTGDLNVMGLAWNTNTTSHIVITPLNGTKLVQLPVSDWTSIKTKKELAAAVETADALSTFELIPSKNSTEEFNFVIATRKEDGTYCLINPTKRTVDINTAHRIVTGQYKK